MPIFARRVFLEETPYDALHRYGLALTLVVLALGATLALQHWLNPIPASLFSLAILVSTWYSGLGPGLLATILSTLAFEYFILYLNQDVHQPITELLRITSWILVVGFTYFLQQTLKSTKYRAHLNDVKRWESETQLSLALEAAHMGVWDWDMRSGQICWSSNHEQLFGLEPGSFTGNYAAFLETVHPDDRDRVTQAIEQAHQLRQDFNQQFRVVWPDGTIRWIASRGRFFYDASDRPTRMLGAVVDITDQKQAEAILQQSNTKLERQVADRTQALTAANQVLQEQIAERRQAEAALYQHEQEFKALLENTPDIIIRCDRQLRYIYVNPAVERTTGLPAEFFLGRTSQEHGAPEHLCHLWDTTMRQVFATGQEAAIEFEAPSTNGWRNYQSRIVPEFNLQGEVQYVLIVSRDITALKQAEAERLQLLRAQTARSEAEAAQQRAAFLAEVSAQLAAPLEYKTTLQQVAYLTVPRLADYCIIYIAEEETGLIRRVAAAHTHPDKSDWLLSLNQYHCFNLNSNHPVAQVISTGQADFQPELSENWFQDILAPDEYLQVLRTLEVRSYVIEPLVARDRTLGAILLALTVPDRRYSAEELGLAADVAHRAALAIDNVRLYQEAQQARQSAECTAERIYCLQTITAALSEALTPLAVAEVIVNQGIAALGAQAGSMVLLNATTQQLEVVKAVGYEQATLADWQKFPLDAPLPLAETVRTTRSIFLTNRAEVIAHYPQLAKTATSLAYEAAVSVPLTIDRQTIGAIGLSFAEVRQFNEADQTLILAIAQQCAQAIARARLYDAERSARAASEATSRSKDEFLAVLSHELRTPLNSILGWSRLLNTRHLDSNTITRALETIERNAKHQAQLIEDILDVSRVIQGKLRLQIVPTHLTSIIAAALDIIQPAAEAKAIRLHSQFDSPIDCIAADPERLQQIIWNLLSNAVKFTPEGGEVTIRLRLVSEQLQQPTQPPTAVNSITPDAHIQLEISDTGPGIPPEFLPYVFDRFRQVDSSNTRTHGGLGLGLSIVRHLVELHGGTVYACSPGCGQGSTFVVKLPVLTQGLEHQPESIRPAIAPATTQPNLEGLKILLVEDEPDAREMLTIVLQGQGATVIAVAAVSEALATLEQWQPDVLVSDIGMPDQSGYDLIQQIRAYDYHNLPAIALTAYAGSEDQQKSLAAGFQMHVAKPVEPATLTSAIANLTGRQQDR